MEEHTAGHTRLLDKAAMLKAAKKLQKQLDELVHELEEHPDQPVVVSFVPAEDAGMIPQVVDRSLQNLVELRKDPLSEYLDCLHSLCGTCGGIWNDGVDGRAAGCHFDTNAGAALYALFAWSCLPSGIVKGIIK